MKFWDRKTYVEKWIFIGKQNCPFCETTKDEKPFIIWETKHWIIRHNKYPYFWNEKHLLAMPKKHRKYTYEMSKKEFGDFKEVEKFIKQFYKTDEYFCILRESTGWRSVEHLHYHFLPWVIFPKEEQWNKYLQINY